MNNNSPLERNILLAAENGDLENFNILINGIENKIYLEFRDFNGYTPLHWAVTKGHLEFSKRLLDLGANINSMTHAGNTPVHLSIFKNHVDVLKMLLKFDANITFINKSGQKPCDLIMDKESGINALLQSKLLETITNQIYNNIKPDDIETSPDDKFHRQKNLTI